MTTVRLAEVASVLRGITFSGADAHTTPFAGGIACLTTAAVKPEVDWDSVRFIPKGLVRSPQLFVGPDDILVSTTNSREKVGTSVRIASMPHQATFGAFVCVIRAGERIGSDYLALWLRSAEFFHQVRRRVTQTTGFANLTISDLLTVEVPLPTPTDQRRMVAQLSGQFAAVDAARIATTQRTADTTLLRVQAIEQAIGKAAEWPSRRLGDVAEIQLGKMLSPASRMGRRPMPYLRNANVQWDRFELSEVHEMDFDVREEAKFRLRPGDVLVCEGGEPGRAAVWAGQIEPCLYQKALHRLRPIEDAVDPQYLVYRLWLSAMRGEFTGNHAQTTIAHLPAIRLAELEIGTPPVVIQRRIVHELRERLSAIDAMTAAMDAELKAIEALPAALLRRAFDDLAA